MYIGLFLLGLFFCFFIFVKGFVLFLICVIIVVWYFFILFNIVILKMFLFIDKDVRGKN